MSVLMMLVRLLVGQNSLGYICHDPAAPCTFAAVFMSMTEGIKIHLGIEHRHECTACVVKVLASTAKCDMPGAISAHLLICHE